MPKTMVRIAMLAAMLLAPQAAGASSPAAGGPVDLAADPALRIDGATGGGFAGNQVAAGDVNGDGLGDVIVETATGTQYVVFGAPGTGDVDLASLGARGFRIFSSDYRIVLATAIAGVPDSAVAGVGDVNGDGYDDIAVTYGYRPSGGPFTEQGAFVVFGHPGSGQVDVAALGSGGYRIRTDSAADVVSVGGGRDVNGDGLDDVVVGRPLFDTHCGSCAITFAGGDAFVVYGKSSSSAIDLGTLGGAGFRVRSGGDNEFLGQTVALVGDMNGDGLAEVVLAAPEAGGGFVVFAQPPGTTVTTTSLGSAGFRFVGDAGVCNGDGWYVADAGDVNDDGVPDVLFGTRDQCPGGGFSQGEARIVYGKADTATVSEATDFAAGKGVRIRGLGFCGCPVPDHLSSLVRVGGAGDVNGDGIDDVVLGGYFGNGGRFSGVAYVVYGGPALPADIDVSALGASGFRIDGASDGDQAGSAVGGVGDFDGDGHPDVAIGAQGADRNGRTDSGTVYVVRGFAPPADLSVTKTASVSDARVGDTFLYTLRAHNDGPAVANGVHAIDRLPAGITFVSAVPSCQHSAGVVDCDFHSLGPGGAAQQSFIVKVTSAPGAGQVHDHWIGVERVEQYVSLDAGESRTLTLSCPQAGAIMTDASAQIESVDQGTGTLASVRVLAVPSTAVGTYEIALRNDATGRAQAKVFGLCVAGRTTDAAGHSHALVVSGLMSQTLSGGGGTVAGSLMCPAGSAAIAPSFRFVTSTGVVASRLLSADLRTLSYGFRGLPGASEQVEASVRCLQRETDATGGAEHALGLQQLARSVTIAAGATVSESVTCPNGSKGIVASYDLPAGVLLAGHEPQPVTRVFRLMNTTGSAQTATIGLLCLGDRTSSDGSATTIVNSATVTGAQPDLNAANDTASVAISVSPAP